MPAAAAYAAARSAYAARSSFRTATAAYISARAAHASASAFAATYDVDAATRAVSASTIAAFFEDDGSASAGSIASTTFADAAWFEIIGVVKAVDEGQSPEELVRRPLWSGHAPHWANSNWMSLKTDLLALDQDWHVWIDWYEDRLHGADHRDSRTLIEALELKRVLIPDEDWEKGPKHVNGIIAALEAEYRGQAASEEPEPVDEQVPAEAPPQQPAIIEVETGEDGKIRRSQSVPAAHDDAQEHRLFAAWLAHSEQLADLEAMEPGKNSPAFGAVLTRYQNALGSSYEEMNVIALGVHGTRLRAFSSRADAILMEDAAAEVASLVESHELFINQFDTWHAYISYPMGEPDTKLVEAAIDVARAMEELSELIDVDVVEAAKDLADAAERPLNVDPEDRTSTIVQTGLLRSVDNILSGLMTPLVAFARDMGIGARKGAVDGSEEFTKKATQVVGWSALASITALASGYPSLFAWLTPVIALLKNKLGM